MLEQEEYYYDDHFGLKEANKVGQPQRYVKFVREWTRDYVTFGTRKQKRKSKQYARQLKESKHSQTIQGYKYSEEKVKSVANKESPE